MKRWYVYEVVMSDSWYDTPYSIGHFSTKETAERCIALKRDELAVGWNGDRNITWTVANNVHTGEMAEDSERNSDRKSFYYLELKQHVMDPPFDATDDSNFMLNL